MDYPTAFAAAHTYEARSWRQQLLEPPGLIEQIAASSRRYATLPAVTEVDALGRVVRSVTYAELWLAVERETRSISGMRDLTGAEGTIGVQTSNDLPSLVTILAVMRAGRAAVVLDFSEPAERLATMASALGCAVLVPGSPRPAVPAAPTADRAAPPVDLPWSTGVVVFTTGSTAASKPVAQSGYAVSVNAHALAVHHKLGPGETLGCPLLISHVNGLEFGMFASLISGAHAVLMSRADPIQLAHALATVDPTIVTMVPSLLKVLTETRGTPEFPRLRYFVSAAAALPTSTAQAVYSRFGTRVVQGYGQSECMNFATTMPVDLTDAEYESIVLGSEIPPVGSALFGCTVSVVDDDGGPVGAGEVGDVIVRGHSLMNGYIGNPKATREVFAGGALWTGDRGRMEPSDTGDRLTLVGRKKLIVKCGGVGISLEEAERHIREVDGVHDVVCVSRPHHYLGEAVTAFVVGEGPTDDDIRARLERWIRPSAVGLKLRRVDAIPLLRSGKPDRTRLTVAAREQ